MPLQLIQKDDCQLCDEAWAVLAEIGVSEFESIWIDGDAQLQARYGVRVPVLRRDDTGAEIDWPFAAEILRRFLA